MDIDTTDLQPHAELLQVADAVAREKGIEREEVLEAMEQAIQRAGRSKYGHEHDIRAVIDRSSGEIRLYRYREVADEVENEATEISLAEAHRRDPNLKVGDFVTEALPPIEFGRIAAQTAKQVIVQRVREYERKRQFAKPPLHPIPLDVREFLPVHTRCALVGAALGIGMSQDVLTADLVVQGVEAIAGFCLRFRVQRHLQFLNTLRS